jgi:hypothetical protein
MTHDHEALRLAIASLDFELTPDERLRMQTGLIECTECAEALASHHELARLLGRLPVLDASPYVRERVLRAALVPPREARWPILLVAAALIGLMLAGAAAAGAFREREPLDTVVVVPSASPAAHGDEASPGPSNSPAPGATEGPSIPPVLGAPLSGDTLAEVVSGRLRVRSQPRVADDSIKFEPLLDVGDRLLILDGPVVANDYEWYEVMAWRPGNLYASWPIGWVARGDHDGTPWLRPNSDPCPTGTITMEVVESMHPPERVACFGDRPLRLRAYVMGGRVDAPCTIESNTACIEGPAWLTGSGGWNVGADAWVDTPSLGGPPLAFDPNGPVPTSALPPDPMVDLEGAFDHPAARDCRPGQAGPDAEPMSVSAARLSCRARFVVTAFKADPDYPVSGTAGITVSDNLRVRADPGLASERYELLPTGTRVWVIDGPVVAADYEWFQIIVPEVDAGRGVPRVGWVAASDHGAEPWLARRAVDCPEPESLDVSALARLTSTGHEGEGLACLGSSTFRFQGTIDVVCGPEDRPGLDMTPEWLSGNAVTRVAIRDGADTVVARPRPDLDLTVSCGEVDARPYVIDGHFDDEAAPTCDATVRDGSASRDLHHVAEYWCRTTLVIERLTPVPVSEVPRTSG